MIDRLRERRLLKGQCSDREQPCRAAPGSYKKPEQSVCALVFTPPMPRFTCVLAAGVLLLVAGCGDEPAEPERAALTIKVVGGGEAYRFDTPNGLAQCAATPAPTFVRCDIDVIGDPTRGACVLETAWSFTVGRERGGLPVRGRVRPRRRCADPRGGRPDRGRPGHLHRGGRAGHPLREPRASRLRAPTGNPHGLLAAQRSGDGGQRIGRSTGRRPTS